MVHKKKAKSNANKDNVNRISQSNPKVDAVTQLLGGDIMQYIVKYLPAHVRAFAMLTCKWWYLTISNQEDFTHVLLTQQAMFVVQHGYLDCLKYLRKSGYEWDVKTCRTAAEFGQLECLKYLHESGCPWEYNTPAYAASGGHLQCLRYAYEHGCVWIETVHMLAAQNGHIECMKYAYLNDLELTNVRICMLAAANGHLECLKYAHDNYCEWDAETCYHAAANGQLSCLRFGIEHGCPWDDQVAIEAARGGHVDCLKYAHERGCDFMGVSEAAASQGHLECLKYASEKESDLDVEACIEGASSTHIFCTVENTCGHDACLKFLQELKYTMK